MIEVTPTFDPEEQQRHLEECEEKLREWMIENKTVADALLFT